MKLRYSILFFAGFLFSTLVSAQKSVTIGGETLNEKAVLMLVADQGDQGFILPRVSDRNLIDPTSAEQGMLVFDDSDGAVFLWDGSTWNDLTQGSGVGITSLNELEDVNSTGATPIAVNLSIK